VDSAAGQDRNYQIDSWLTGTGTIEWRQFTTALGGPDMNITCPTNTFSGRWHVFAGTLLGSGANSLGTNSITVETGGALETAYDLNTPTANLTLNGQMFLHQNDTFRTLTLGNYLVPGPATYTYGQLAASFPGSFPGAWALQAGSSVNTASGSITVLAGQTVNTISNSFTVVGNTLSFSGTGGLANGKYYVLSSTNVALPKASWVRSGPFPFDNLGNFGTSVPIVSTNKQQFFQLQQIVP
jgi:hypothetical protein